MQNQTYGSRGLGANTGGGGDGISSGSNNACTKTDRTRTFSELWSRRRIICMVQRKHAYALRGTILRCTRVATNPAAGFPSRSKPHSRARLQPKLPSTEADAEGGHHLDTFSFSAKAITAQSRMRTRQGPALRVALLSLDGTSRVRLKPPAFGGKTGFGKCPYHHNSMDIFSGC